MPTPPNSSIDPPAVVARSFTGMASNLDPHDIRPGQSIFQVNIIAGLASEMRVRLGCKQVKFDS
jgi:hypothetical protein